MVKVLPPRSTRDDLAYGHRWTTWLAEGEVITNATVECVVGDTVVSQVSHTDDMVVFRLSGGTYAGSVVHQIEVTVTTNAAPPNRRAITLPITISGS